MPAEFSTTRMHRIAKEFRLEVLRTDDDFEDMTDILIRSYDSLPYHWCPGCMNRGVKTRIAKRSRCFLCYKVRREARAA